MLFFLLIVLDSGVIHPSCQKPVLWYCRGSVDVISFVTFTEPLSDLSRKLSPEDIFSDIRSPQYGRAHGVSLSTQEKQRVESQASEYEQILV